MAASGGHWVKGSFIPAEADLPILSGDPNPELHARIAAKVAELEREFPIMKGKINGVRYEGPTDISMAWEHEDDTFRVPEYLSQFDPPTWDRIQEDWSRREGTVYGGLDGLLDHEMTHPLTSTIQRELGKAKGWQWNVNRDYYDGIKELRGKLGDPSSYSKKNLDEWMAERRTVEKQGKAEPVLTNHLKQLAREAAGG